MLHRPGHGLSIGMIHRRGREGHSHKYQRLMATGWRAKIRNWRSYWGWRTGGFQSWEMLKFGELGVPGLNPEVQICFSVLCMCGRTNREDVQGRSLVFACGVPDGWAIFKVRSGNFQTFLSLHIFSWLHHTYLWPVSQWQVAIFSYTSLG